MVRYAPSKIDSGRPFTWRDALAYFRGMPRGALYRKQGIPFTALARVSAVDVRALPQRKAFTASDGGTIAYRTYESASSASLILVHGAACFGDQLHRLASHIAVHGLATVHTLDMRGHGGSAPAPDFPDRFAMDIGEFAEMLRQSRKPSAIVIGGHSAGGGLVLNALRSPYLQGISGCLLLAPFLAIDSPTLRQFFGGWLSRVRRIRLGLIVVANALGTRRFNHLPVVDFDAEAFLHDPRYAREWSFNTIFGFSPGPVAAPPLADMPVLLLAGTADDCFHPERYADALRKIAPQGEIALLPNLGHWDVLTHPSALETCAAWLDALLRENRLTATEARRRLA